MLCGRCGEEIGTAEDPLKDARVIMGPPEEAGPVRGEMYAELYGKKRFHLRRQVCPGCGTQLEVRVTMEGAPLPGWKFF